MKRQHLGLVLGVAGAVVGVGVGLLACVKNLSRPPARAPFGAGLDPNGPYVLASSEDAAHEYGEALAEARQLHPGAIELVFPLADLRSVAEAFRRLQPRYALVLLLPEELDVNFAWRWLRLTTAVDDDPFVDVRTGFITGATPSAAANFLHRIRTAVEQRTPLSGLAVDDLGPNSMAPKNAFLQTPGNFMVPVLGERVGLSTISHGVEAFNRERLASLNGAALVHLGGHGYPDRIVDGLSGDLTPDLKLSPCVVFNGACYTGVTGRWFEMGATVSEQRIAPERSFCLGVLANNVLGYLAALHPDHGLPVYQELEFLATDGASLGEVMKHTHDGVILAAGGRLPSLESLTNGMPNPQWTPAEVMLKGTASRVLFGDPALVLTPSFTAPPFAVSLREAGPDALRVTAVLSNVNLKSTFTDTYHADLASDPNLFNDRALIRCQLPDGWETVQSVEVIHVTGSAKPLKSRLVGFGVEKEGSRRFLQVQVDVPSAGYLQSQLRTAGASVELKIQR